MSSPSHASEESATHWPLPAIAFALFVIVHLHAAIAALALPLLLLGFGLAAWCGQIDFAQRFDRVDAALLAFAATWLLCAAQAIDPERAFTLSVPLAIALFSTAVLRRAASPERSADLILLALALLAGWLAAAAAGVALMAATSVDARVAAINSPWLVVPNDLAWAACLWPCWKARLGRAGSFFLWLLLFAGLVALQSRLGLLLLALITVLDLAGHLRRRQRWVLVGLLLVGLMLLTPWMFDKGLASVLARLQLWQSAWGLFLEHPWLGVGPHCFVIAYPDLPPVGGQIDPRLTPWPHSLPLELLAEGGIAMALATSVLLFFARDALGGRIGVPVLASFLMLCLVEASTLRLWFWAILVLLLLPSSVRSQPQPR